MIDRIQHGTMYNNVLHYVENMYIMYCIKNLIYSLEKYIKVYKS